MNKTKADTTAIYIANGVISPEEARMRLVEDKTAGYSFLKGVELEEPSEEDKAEIEQMMKEAQNKGDKNNNGQDTAFDGNNEEPESWITVKGNHIPIFAGQSKEDAIKEFLKSKTDQKEQKKEKQVQETLTAFEKIKKSVPKEIADKMNAVNIDYTKDNELPEINKKEADDLGIEILPIRLKQSIIDRNKGRHPEVDPRVENALLATALYSPDNTAAGKGKGYIHFAKHIGNKNNSLVLLDMERTEDGFYDIVHYYFINDNRRKKVMNEK